MSESQTLIVALIAVNFILVLIAAMLVSRSKVHDEKQRLLQGLFAALVPIIGPILVIGAQIAVRVKNRPPSPDHDFKDNKHFWGKW